MSETVPVIAMLIIFALYFIALALSIAQYVITSYSLYAIAKRRMIENPFLAFIPIVSYWITGSIADEYDGRSGFNYKWRKILITFPIIMLACFLLFFIAITVLFFYLGMSLETDEVPIVAIIMFMASFIPYFFILLCAIVTEIINCICIYKIFESTVGSKAVKYLIISLLVPFGYPICLLKSKDKGYSNIPPAFDYSAYPPPPPAPFEYNPNDMQMPN